MDQGPDRSFEARDFGWLVAMSLVFFALVAAALLKESRPRWRPLQRQFRILLETRAGVQQAQAFNIGIKQIWIPKIQVVDRCTTCHLGYEWAAVLPSSIPQPLTPHPDPPFMSKHPFEEFGCTPCHGGQGWATTAEAAHGGQNWGDPLLSSAMAQRYGLTQRELLQMRCNFCHRHDVATPGMDEINLAKKLFKSKKCIVCHTVEGRGGTAAAELTLYGDQDPELVDYSRIVGEHTLFNWNYQHFLKPDRVSPGTSMPTFGFTPDQARALTLLMLSWRREIFPPEYIPPPLVSQPTPAARPVSGPNSDK